MKTTVTQLVKSIPERLGLELDLSTPQKAYDFLNDDDFPIFYLLGESHSLGDYLYCMNHLNWTVHCGHKAMYVFNDLFSPEKTANDEKYKYYSLEPDEAKIEYLIDYGDDIEYLEDISFYEKQNTEYIAELCSGVVDFKSILNACAKICKETNDYMRFETSAFHESEGCKWYGYDISADGKVNPFGEFVIYDNNADCFAGDISLFIALFGCKTFEDMEEICIPYKVKSIEKKDIDITSGIFYVYKNKQKIRELTDIREAAEIVSRYPVALAHMPEEIQHNKTVAKAFIDANEPYMVAYKKILAEHTGYGVGGWLRLGAIIDSESTSLLLNGEVPFGDFGVRWRIHSSVFKTWCLDEELFEKLLGSSMREECCISKELFEELNHKRLFSLNPYYIVLLRRYYKKHTDSLDEKARDKEDLHIRRKYRLSENVSEDNIITLKAIEKIEKDCPDAIKILSQYFDDIETVNLVKDYLLSLPKEERYNLIKKNIRLAYPIRNTLSNDDEIVDYICEICECAGDFLSDEIVEIRGLKRTSLNMSKVCEDCDFC